METRVISATGNTGFTLLELLVVLTILVLLAGAWPLAAPHLFPTQQLRNEAQLLVGQLRIARTTARVTGNVQNMEIPGSGTAYRVAAQTHDLPSGLSLHLRDTVTRASSNTLMFFPDGSSTGGTLDIARTNRAISIRVSHLTGRAEIVE